MLPCSQRTLILVQTRGKFRRDCRLVAAAVASVYIVYSKFQPLRHKVTNASNMYAANPGCHCWMISLSDALPTQSYPSKVWFLCVAMQICARDNLFPTDLFSA